MRAQSYMRQHPFYLKTDIVKFFPNVDHKVLMSVIGNTVCDESVLALVRIILKSGVGIHDDVAPCRLYPGDDLLSLTRPRGLPIGNLTSQFFANVLLDPIDHFIKEQLRVPGYVRYADDLLLFGPSKSFLWDTHTQLVEKFGNFRLSLHPNKTVLNPTWRKMNYLGFSVSTNGRRLTQDALRRWNRRLRKQKWLAKRGKLAPQDVSRSLNAWSAHADFANTIGVRKALFHRTAVTYCAPEQGTIEAKSPDDDVKR